MPTHICHPLCGMFVFDSICFPLATEGHAAEWACVTAKVRQRGRSNTRRIRNTNISAPSRAISSMQFAGLSLRPSLVFRISVSTGEGMQVCGHTEQNTHKVIFKVLYWAGQRSKCSNYCQSLHFKIECSTYVLPFAELKGESLSQGGTLHSVRRE